MVEGGPADKAGLQAEDVITMVGTATISSRDDLTSAIGSKSYQAGDTVTVTYVRNGQVQTTELTFGSTTEMADATSQQSQQQEQQSQSGGYPYGGSMEDFFDEFFGTGRSSGRSAA